MSSTPPAWHAEARELHKSGKTVQEIAAIYGKRIDHVRNLMNEAKYEANRKWQAKRRVRKDAAKPAAPKPAKPDTMALARLFVAGKIDRAELSRRLRGEARP